MNVKETIASAYICNRDDVLINGSDLIKLTKDILEKGLPIRLRASGFSMSPFIKSGDVITIIPLKNHLPRIGDVVAEVG